MDNTKFSFLKSVRFWNLVIVATVIVLQKQGIIIDNSLVDTISEIVSIVLTGSTIVRTVDRVADKKVEAAEVSAGL
ncbi:MAG TPA: hypothetical protein VGE62_01135 [Candidatus Paceibacterota bacterium]